MRRHVIISYSAMALIVVGVAGLASSAQAAGPLDAAAISATASTPIAPPITGPTITQPLTAGSLTSPLGGITSAPTPRVAQPAQPAAAAPAK